MNNNNGSSSLSEWSVEMTNVMRIDQDYIFWFLSISIIHVIYVFFEGFFPLTSHVFWIIDYMIYT